MFVNILILLVSFIFLIKAANLFIESSSKIVINLGVSKFLVGLTLVAFGTSLPEFSVSMQSLSNNSPDIIFGNVIGSNIVNILFIIGITSLFVPIKLSKKAVKKELPIFLLITLLLPVLYFDNIFHGSNVNTFSRFDALIILSFFALFIYYLISIINKDKNEVKNKISFIKNILIFICSLVVIIFSSDIIVHFVIKLATDLNISQKAISMTVIAIGASMPELVTTITAAKKGEYDLLVGNIIGSNIINICVVLGIPVLFYGNISPTGFTFVDFGILIISAFMLAFFIRKNKALNKFHSFIFIGIFLLYYLYLFS